VSAAAIVSFVLFALLIGWLGIVLAETWRQLHDDIAADAGRRGDR